MSSMRSQVVYLFDFLFECDLSPSLETKARHVYTRIVEFYLGCRELDTEVYVSLHFLTHFFTPTELLILVGCYGFTRARRSVEEAFSFYTVNEGDLVVWCDPNALPVLMAQPCVDLQGVTSVIILSTW